MCLCFVRTCTCPLAGALAAQMVATLQQHMLTLDVCIRCVPPGLGKPSAEQHCCFCLGCAASLCVHASMSESMAEEDAKHKKEEEIRRKREHNRIDGKNIASRRNNCQAACPTLTPAPQPKNAQQNGMQNWQLCIPPPAPMGSSQNRHIMQNVQLHAPLAGNAPPVVVLQNCQVMQNIETFRPMLRQMRNTLKLPQQSACKIARPALHTNCAQTKNLRELKVCMNCA